MAACAAQVPEAEALVETFMRAHQLTSSKVPLGKLMTVIKETRPLHWQALKNSLGVKYPKLGYA